MIRSNFLQQGIRQWTYLRARVRPFDHIRYDLRKRTHPVVGKTAACSADFVAGGETRVRWIGCLRNETDRFIGILQIENAADSNARQIKHRAAAVAKADICLEV